MSEVPSEEYVRQFVEEHAVKSWIQRGSFYGGGEREGFEVFFNGREFRAETKQELVWKIVKRFTEEAKDRELTQLALKYGKGHQLLLPSKNIVDFVLENCPTWKKETEGMDKRGVGNKVGRRIAKLNIPQE